MADKNLVIGVDLGRMVDRSAVTVTEHVAEVRYIDFPGPHDGHTGADCPCHEQITHKYEVLDLHRWPQFTSYSTVVNDIGVMMHTSELQDALLAIDATGVGHAVFQMFNNAYRNGRLGAWWPIGYSIAGSGESDGPDNTSPYQRIVKNDLVGRLIVALEQHLITIPATLHDAPHLGRELAGFRRKMSQRAGLATFAAESASDHDDLVASTMLSIWRHNHHAEPRRVIAAQATPMVR